MKMIQNCVVEHIHAYILKTKAVRKCDELFISYIKPHKHVFKDTISRWFKEVMKLSGIDVKSYSSHSCRLAPSSKAKEIGVSLKSILENAGWKERSRNDTVELLKRKIPLFNYIIVFIILCCCVTFLCKEKTTYKLLNNRFVLFIEYIYQNKR